MNRCGASDYLAATTGEARVYRVKDGTRVATLPGAQGALFSLAFSPDGKQIAVGGIDGQVRLYTVPAGQIARAFVPVPLAARVAARTK